MILLKLFLVFLRIGFFAIGGAYSFLPLMEKELVQNYQWLDKPEFLEVGCCLICVVYSGKGPPCSYYHQRCFVRRSAQVDNFNLRQEGNLVKKDCSQSTNLLIM